jgi:hypothetical protein
VDQHSCKSCGLFLSWKAIFLFCLPVIALIVGSGWQKGRLLLWIPAFIVMGAACLVNAARCGRIHCYATGPLSLLAIIYIVLAQFHLVPMDAGYFLDSILAISILAFLIELPLGRYRARA